MIKTIFNCVMILIISSIIMATLNWIKRRFQPKIDVSEIALSFYVMLLIVLALTT